MMSDFSQPQPLFESLIASEIEFSVSAVPHLGFALAVGDPAHGPYQSGRVSASKEIGPWLDSNARDLFPASDYAKAFAAYFAA